MLFEENIHPMSESAPWLESREVAAACGMVIARQAHLAPDRTAIIARPGRCTFGELNAQANQLSRALRERGLGEQSSVALICSNRYEFMVAHAACHRSGLKLTPVNWHLTGDEMAYIVANSEAQAVIAEVRFSDVAQRAAQSPSVVARIAIGGTIAGFEDYEPFLSQHSGRDIDDPMLGSPMLYTSGTTGHPKGVYRWPPRPSNMLAALFQPMIEFRPDTDLALLTGPAYHAAPLNLNAVAALAQGVGLVMMDRWDAEETLRVIEAHQIVYTHVVATMFNRMLKLPEQTRQRYDLSSLRAVLHGAAPCPLHVKRAMIEWWGPIIFEYYAATEGGATLASSENWLARPGTVGQATEGAHVRVLDEHKHNLPPGTCGTIYFRSPEEGGFVYYKSDAKTASSYHENYFTMGDQGYIDEDGYVFLTGRDAELIISGGVNIYPQEVDDILLQRAEVRDVCTIGIPNDDWGEEVRAVVELEPGITQSVALAEELLAYCRAHLAHFKCPRTVDFETGLPRLPSGKIQRHKVRAPYWPQASR